MRNYSNTKPGQRPQHSKALRTPTVPASAGGKGQTFGGIILCMARLDLLVRDWHFALCAHYWAHWSCHSNGAVDHGFGLWYSSSSATIVTR